jgi:ATP-binding cassette subfamily F protein uup
VFEGDGKIGEYVGGYSDWLAQEKPAESKPAAAKAEKASAPKPAPAPSKKKMSYKEQRELESLPERIETLEARQAELNDLINSADFYRQDAAAVKKLLEEAEALPLELEAAYQRWNELDAMA